MNFSFKDLFAGHDSNSFVDNYFEKKVLHGKSLVDIETLNSIFSFVEFQKVLWIVDQTMHDRAGVIDVVTNKEEKKPGRISHPGNYSKWVMDNYKQGSTLLLNKAQRFSENIATLQRLIEAELNFKVSTNIYISPENANCFDIHFDTHDTFIIQLEGSKNWQIFDRYIEAPLEEQNHSIKLSDLKNQVPTMQFNLMPGEILYIPRGIPHLVQTLDTQSIHMTLSFKTCKWIDVFSEALNQFALQNSFFRETASAKLSTRQDQKKFNEIAEGLFYFLQDKMTARASFDWQLKRMTHSLLPLSYHKFPQPLPAEVNLTTVLGHKNGAVLNVCLEGDYACLSYPGVGMENGVPSLPGSIKFPSRLETTLRFIAQNPTFAIADLPGPLTEKSKLILAERLVKEEVLEIK